MIRFFTLFTLICLGTAHAQVQTAPELIIAFDQAAESDDSEALQAASQTIIDNGPVLSDFLTMDEAADLFARMAQELLSIGDTDGAAMAMQEALSLNRVLLERLEQDEEAFTTFDVYSAREAYYARLIDAADLLGQIGDERQAGEYQAAADALFEAYLTPGEIDLTTMGGNPIQTDSDGEPFQIVRVFYGTNRGVRSDSPNYAYNNVSTNLTFGTIDVSVPLEREIGSVPRPGIGGEQASRHVILRSINRLGEDGFGGQLRESVEDSRSGRDDVLIFIHGHGVTFSQAARQTATLAVDLDIRDGAVLYSWPNGESANAYLQSQARVGISSRRFASFLEEIMAEVGDGDIHIIAHSMGNRILLNALERIYDPDSSEPAFSHIFWASADVNVDLFQEAITEISDIAEGMTAYTSSRDRALNFSSSLSDSVRAGQSEPLPEVAEIITAVDTTALSVGLIGHADFANAMMEDMQSVVWLSLPPEGRCILVPVAIDESARFWRAVDDRPECEKDAYRRALWAIRLFGEDAQSSVQAAINGNQIPSEQLESWRAALFLIAQMDIP